MKHTVNYHWTLCEQIESMLNEHNLTGVFSDFIRLGLTLVYAFCISTRKHKTFVKLWTISAQRLDVGPPLYKKYIIFVFAWTLQQGNASHAIVLADNVFTRCSLFVFCDANVEKEDTSLTV